MRIPLTRVRGKGFTIMGAVSHALKEKGYFEVVDSTNSRDFTNYLHNLRDAIKPECR